MNEEKAREIFKEHGIEVRKKDEIIRIYYGTTILHWFGGSHSRLNAVFTADELEAIAWWMRNKK